MLRSKRQREPADRRRGNRRNSLERHANAGRHRKRTVGRWFATPVLIACAMAGPVVFAAGSRRWTLPPAEIGKALGFAPEGGDFRVVLDRGALEAGLEDVYGNLTVRPVEAGYKVNGGDVTVTP